jgi:hypothetical protein
VSQPHPNDPFGHHADAAAARRRLAELDDHAELQKALPDLRAQRDAILRRKQEVADMLAYIGGHNDQSQSYRDAHQAILQEIHDLGASEERSRRLRDLKDTERDALVEQLRAVNLELNTVNAAIAAIPPVMAPSDRHAHLEDLRRRAGV